MGTEQYFTDQNGVKVAKTSESDPVANDNFLNTLDDTDDKEMFEKLLNYKSADAEQFPYLVRGATLRCDCGSHARKLNLPLCHAVYVDGAPAVHERDCSVGDAGNIPTFGVCNAAAIERTNTTEILLKSEDGASNIKGRPCTPVIVGGKWLNAHHHTLIADNCPGAKYISPENRIYYPALTTDSFLVCGYSGLIEPVTSGQEESAQQKVDPQMSGQPGSYDLSGESIVAANRNVPIVGQRNTYDFYVQMGRDAAKNRLNELLVDMSDKADRVAATSIGQFTYGDRYKRNAAFEKFYNATQKEVPFDQFISDMYTLVEGHIAAFESSGGNPLFTLGGGFAINMYQYAIRESMKNDGDVETEKARRDNLDLEISIVKAKADFVDQSNYKYLVYEDGPVFFGYQSRDRLIDKIHREVNTFAKNPIEISRRDVLNEAYQQGYLEQLTSVMDMNQNFEASKKTMEDMLNEIEDAHRAPKR
jgi:hypothetical protein